MLERTEAHRQAWSDGAPLGEDREELRQEILIFGRSLRDGGDQRGSALMQLGASIGTPS
jgi:hypothetical protein